MLDFENIVKYNRSYRGFDESYRFTKDQLVNYVNLTRFTASSVNAQPLKYIVAYKPEDSEKILSMTKWARALPNMKLPKDGMHPTGFIIILQDKKISENLARYQKDIGIVAQTITLAAAAEGLGCCMIGNFNPDEVKERMNITTNLEPMLIIALGKPAEKIVIKEIDSEESIKYYRDDNDVHYVPKRKLEDILIDCK